MAENDRAKVARVTKKPDTKFVQTDRLIDWISREADEQGHPLICRTPQPKVNKFPKLAGFLAAGSYYLTLGSLTKTTVDKDKNLYRDHLGRLVLAVQERFPCFDSYDYEHENRYYRWFYLIHKERLTCVYYADESMAIEVTEDVRVINKRAWEAMVSAGILQDDILRM